MSSNALHLIISHVTRVLQGLFDFYSVRILSNQILTRKFNFCVCVCAKLDGEVTVRIE